MKLEPGLMALVDHTDHLNADVVRSVELEPRTHHVWVELDVDGWVPIERITATRYADRDGVMHWITQADEEFVLGADRVQP